MLIPQQVAVCFPPKMPCVCCGLMRSSLLDGMRCGGHQFWPCKPSNRHLKRRLHKREGQRLAPSIAAPAASALSCDDMKLSP